MKFNLHTHTSRCGHARGQDRDYVVAATVFNLDMMGFSDHTPYVFEGDFYSGFRMRPDRLADYCESVLALREEFKGQIDIKLGLEAEYYPRFFDKFLRLIEPYPIEYLILGQHFIGDEIENDYSGEATTDPERLHRYVSQVIEAINTGHFTYIAHPDLINFKGDEQIYRREIVRLCEEAKKLGIPLEANMLGYFDGRHYPNQLFWEIAGEVGVQALTGCDAHEPRKCGNPVLFETGDGILRDHGITPMTDPPVLRR